MIMAFLFGIAVGMYLGVIAKVLEDSHRQLTGGRYNGPLAWLERDFIGIRLLGWQFDLRTAAHHRFFSERQRGCGYRANLHLHAQRHGVLYGLCFRAIRLQPPT